LDLKDPGPPEHGTAVHLKENISGSWGLSSRTGWGSLGYLTSKENQGITLYFGSGEGQGGAGRGRGCLDALTC